MGWLWPPLLPPARGARVLGHVLALLVVEFAVAAAFDRSYWADSAWPRTGAAGRPAAPAVPPLLLLGAALAGAPGGRTGAGQRLLSAAAPVAAAALLVGALALRLLRAAGTASARFVWAVWVPTVGLTVFPLLAPLLGASPTCGPIGHGV